jgi:hypothetical protein
LVVAQAHLLRLVLLEVLVLAHTDSQTEHTPVVLEQMVKVMLVEKGFRITQVIQTQVEAAVLARLAELL